jgi:hypothetical protein
MAMPAEGAPVPFSATAETIICFSQPSEFARAMCGWPRQMATEASKPVARTRLRMNEAGMMAPGIVPHRLDRMAIPQSIDLPGNWKASSLIELLHDRFDISLEILGQRSLI